LTRALAVLVCALALLVPAAVHATSVLELTVPQHVADSVAVVEARVVGTRQTVDDATGRPLTHTRVLVLATLAGAAPAAFEISQWKGRVGETEFGFAGDGLLVPGTEVLLFVAQGDGRYWLTALAQSVWELAGRSDDARAVRQLDGLQFFERDPASGALTPARKGAAASVSTLGALRAAVRAAGGGR